MLTDPEPGQSSWRNQLRIALLDRGEARGDAAILRAQYHSIGALVPLIWMAVGAMALAGSYGSGGAFDWVYHVAIPAGFIGVGIVRMLIWRARAGSPVDAATMSRRLRSTAIVALAVALAGSIWTLDAFHATVEVRRVLAPIFVVLVTLVGAICLSPLPRTAIMVMLVATGPVCIAMLASDDIGLRSVSLAMIILMFFMAGLICRNFMIMVTSLQMRAELRTAAETDLLTGLANRRALWSAYDRAAEEAGGPERFALLLIDLDDFKSANDRHGHAAGDAVLRETGKRLTMLCPDALCIARLGGDEFAILFDDALFAPIAGEIRQSLETALSLPVTFEDRMIPVGATTGCATGSDLATMMRAADADLYSGKRLRAAA